MPNYIFVSDKQSDIDISKRRSERISDQSSPNKDKNPGKNIEKNIEAVSSSSRQCTKSALEFPRTIPRCLENNIRPDTVILIK